MQLSDSLIEKLRILVSHRTTVDNPAGFAEAFSYFRQLAEKNHWHIADGTVNGYTNMVISSRQSMRSKILFQAHLDVVPANATQFTMVQQSGRLYGRGVFDMKFAAACYAQLLEDLGSEQ